MEKSEQNTEASKGKAKKIRARRNAVYMDREELDSHGLQRALSQTIDKSDQQSFQALTSDVSQQISDKVPMSENVQKKLSSNENLQR